MRVLFVCDDPLIPINSGGRREIVGEINGLRKIGHTVTLVIFHHKGALSAEMKLRHKKKFGKTIFIPRLGVVGATILRPLLPYQLSSRRISREDSALSWIGPQDIVIAQHEWTLPAAAKIARGLSRPLVLRSHNDPTKYLRALYVHAHGFRKLYFFAELVRVRRCIKPIFYNPVSEIYPISRGDKAAYDGLGVRVHTLAPVLFEGGATRRVGAPKNNSIAYVGAMDMPHALNGLLWFIRDVFPLVRAAIPGATLNVAGRRATPQVTDLLRNFEGISFVGEINDASSFLLNARVFINPVFDGSGINMKVGPPASIGLPIVSTSLGIRGLDALDDGVAKADDPVEFAARVVQLLASDDDWLLSSERLISAIERYSADQIGIELSKRLESHIKTMQSAS